MRNENINSESLSKETYYQSRRAYSKAYRQRNYARIMAKSKEHRNNNIERIRTDDRARAKAKYHSDIEHRVFTCLKNRATQAGIRMKKEEFIAMLGYSITEAMEHIAELFLDDMSWDNHGEWELDHILPISSFDLSNVVEQKKCFHYSNLQPLWSSDNKRKYNKIL
jgi:hypothetical protein